MESVLRKAQYKTISDIKLSGSVIDLGGDKSSSYQKLFKGNFSLLTLNNSESAKPDILHDLEKLLPFKDESYDCVLLINVLEHIYNYQQLLLESFRVLNRGGKIVISVPFLFPIHPSPNDFWRFTDETLVRTLSDAGFQDICVTALGSGVFSARVLMLQRLLPAFLQVFYNFIITPFAKLFDNLFVYMAYIFRKKYKPSDYALGFLVTAKKNEK